MVVLHADIAMRAHVPAPAAPRVVMSRRSSGGARRVRTAPALARAGEPPSVVLTALPLLVARPALQDALAALHCAVRAADSWRQILDVAERSSADVVLVDVDAADRARGGHLFDMSGRRLVELLARISASRRFALVVQTALDFAEIDGMLRLGVHALVGPTMADEDLGTQVRALIARAPYARRAHGPECHEMHGTPDLDHCRLKPPAARSLSPRASM